MNSRILVGVYIGILASSCRDSNSNNDSKNSITEEKKIILNKSDTSNEGEQLSDSYLYYWDQSQWMNFFPIESDITREEALAIVVNIDYRIRVFGFESWKDGVLSPEGINASHFAETVRDIAYSKLNVGHLSKYFHQFNRLSTSRFSDYYFISERQLRKSYSSEFKLALPELFN